MDFIVIVFRTLANPLRLRLLLTVYSEPGLSVEQIARRVGRPVSVVSRHLKQLAQLHLVQPRPTGRFVNYQPPEPGSTRNEMLMGLQRLLQEVLRENRLNSTLSKVWNSTSGAASQPAARLGARGSRTTEPRQPPRSWQDVFDHMVRCFTAYTHLRRLLCLRHALAHGRFNQPKMMSDIGMSANAVMRHMRKLTRRGVTRPGKDADGWELDMTRTGAFQQAVFDLVRKALPKGNG